MRRAALLAVALLAAGCAAQATRPAGALTDAQRAAIVVACEQLSLQYAWYIDSGDYTHLPEVFTPDGQWDVGGNHSAGRAAIGAYWQARVQKRGPQDGSRALVTNQRIQVIDADHATGSSYFTIYRYVIGGPNKALTPTVFTRSVDEYLRTPEGWRIKSRRIETQAEAAP